MTTKVKPSVLADTAVTAGTYGGSTQHAVFTVDAQGRLVYAANATPSIATSQLTGTISSAQIASQSDPSWLTSLSKSKVGLGNVDNTADANKSVSYAATAGSAGNGGVTSLAAGRGITLSSTTGGITISSGSGKMSSHIYGSQTYSVPNPTTQFYNTGWIDFNSSTFTSNGDPTVCIGSFEFSTYTNDDEWQSGYFDGRIRAYDTSTGQTHEVSSLIPTTLVATGREGSTRSASLICSPAFKLTSLVAGRSYKWQLNMNFGKLNSSGAFVSWSNNTQAVQFFGNMVAFEI